MTPSTPVIHYRLRCLFILEQDHKFGFGSVGTQDIWALQIYKHDGRTKGSGVMYSHCNFILTTINKFYIENVIHNLMYLFSQLVVSRFAPALSCASTLCDLGNIFRHNLDGKNPKDE